jgi:DNA-directed RNA polymerase specialized sigma24 family protein
VNRHDSEERDADFTAFAEANGPRLLHTARLLTGDPHRAGSRSVFIRDRVFLPRSQ